MSSRVGREALITDESTTAADGYDALVATLLKPERHFRILELLRTTGKILSSELAVTFDVSEDTIRRDLDELGAEGKLKRVHGGALVVSTLHQDYRDRRGQEASAKSLVARAAASLLQDGQVILIDGGTTAIEVTKQLDPQLRATFVTHSPSTAVNLAEHPNCEVVVVGGRLLKNAMVTVGAQTLKTYESINADVAILGILGINVDSGITHFEYEEAQIKRAMIEGAHRSIVLCTSDKLGYSGAFQVAPLASITTLAVEPGLDPALLRQYRDSGVECVSIDDVDPLGQISPATTDRSL